MYPTTSLRPFVVQNDIEVRQMVGSFCRSLNFHENGSDIISDIVQELYLKFKIEGIIERYDPLKNTLISTYLFRIIRNFVINYVKEHRRKTHFFNPFIQSYPEIDIVDNGHNQLAPEYLNLLDRNSSAIEPDLNGFKHFLQKSGKNFKFRLDRRKDRNQTGSCSLLELYDLIYEGHTIKDIAHKFGVTKTSVYNMKAKLIKVMQDYGIRVSDNKKFFVMP